MIADVHLNLADLFDLAQFVIESGQCHNQLTQLDFEEIYT